MKKANVNKANIGDNTIQQRSLHYLYGQLRKARIAMGHAEEKGNALEIANLKNKIDVLEWVTGVVLKENPDA